MKLQPFESGKRTSALEISRPEFSDAQANGQGKPAKVGKCRASARPPSRVSPRFL